MKKILALICISMLILTSVVMAESSNDLIEIKSLLENGKIKNYETILIPLKGDPENFNILPTDDLKTICFGDGVEGYKVDFEALESSVESGENKVKSHLIKDGKYYFPIIVSEREVAMAEIVKENGESKVLCVSSGGIFENFVEAAKDINICEAYYVVEPSMINGFVVEDGNTEKFIDLDKVDFSTTLEPQSRMGNDENIAEIFLKRNSERVVTESDEVIIGGGHNGAANENNIWNYVWIVTGLMILASFSIFVYKKKIKG